MAIAIKLCFAFFLVFFFYTGNAQNCTVSNIVIKQTVTQEHLPTGDKVFQVDVLNTCSCIVSGIYFRADGFYSSVPVEPMYFRQEGDRYLVYNGEGILSRITFTFTYAWSDPYSMTVDSITPDGC